MGFLDNISRSVSQGIDRAKFEAEKIAKIARVQGEISEVRRSMDAKRLELADRAYELYKAGQIQSPTIAALAREVDNMRSSVILKEDELKIAQGDAYIEPFVPGPPSASQSVPVSYDSPAPSSAGFSPGNKPCPTCSFVMPTSAMFCPNCGTRVAT
ncbi:MAG: zinc ribbon domain-containing protein [Roseiflexaceae bacterium]|nr:zinc ribbon domain-containing protein [Roseiflexaceae bacterium]